MTKEEKIKAIEIVKGIIFEDLQFNEHFHSGDDETIFMASDITFDKYNIEVNTEEEYNKYTELHKEEIDKTFDLLVSDGTDFKMFLNEFLSYLQSKTEDEAMLNGALENIDESELFFDIDENDEAEPELYLLDLNKDEKSFSMIGIDFLTKRITFIDRVKEGDRNYITGKASFSNNNELELKPQSYDNDTDEEFDVYVEELIRLPIYEDCKEDIIARFKG